MKKIIFIVLMTVFLTSVSFSQIWYPANQKTVAWDAITALDDGSPIPTGETIQYRIFIAAESDITKTNKTEIGVTTATSYTINFSIEGRYFIGIQAERLQAGTLISQSQISWSDVSAYCQNGETFGVAFFKIPNQPQGLRPL